MEPGKSEETTPVYCGCLQLQDPHAAMRREMAGPQGTPSSSPLSGYWICTDLVLPQEILKPRTLPGSQSYHWPSGSLLHGLGYVACLLCLFVLGKENKNDLSPYVRKTLV